MIMQDRGRKGYSIYALFYTYSLDKDSRIYLIVFILK